VRLIVRLAARLRGPLNIFRSPFLLSALLFDDQVLDLFQLFPDTLDLLLEIAQLRSWDLHRFGSFPSTAKVRILLSPFTARNVLAKKLVNTPKTPMPKIIVVMPTSRPPSVSGSVAVPYRGDGGDAPPDRSPPETMLALRVSCSK